MGFYLAAGVYSRELDLSTVIPAVSTSVGALVGYSEKGPVGTDSPFLVTSTKQFTELYGNPTPVSSYMHYTALAFLRESKRLYIHRVTNGATFGGVVCHANDGSTTTKTTALSAVASDPTNYSFSAGELFTIYPANPGAHDNLQIEISEVDAVNFEFQLEVKELLSDGTTKTRVKEMVSRKATQKDGNGRNQYIETVLAENVYVRALDNTLIADTVVPNADTVFVSMLAGSVGSAVDASHINTGWEQFQNANEITVNLLLNGGNTDDSTHAKMDTIAQARKDCIAVLDIPRSLGRIASSAVSYRKTTLALNSSYSSLESPWVIDYDQANGKKVTVPPSGYIGATIAYTDRNRDAWWANSGLNRGVLPIRGLDKFYSDGDLELLYEAQINPIILHPAGVYCSWGQKMLQTRTSATDRRNVRRLLIVLQKAISTALAYYLFDPNDAISRSRITTLINDYLEDIEARRGLSKGPDGEEAFKVVCDGTNNTASVIDRNELHVDMYLRPTKSAEFIQLQSIITTSGANFDEIIAQGAF